MITKIQKWGNSLGVRIPKALAEDIPVADGVSVDLKVEDGRLVIRPIKQTAYDLDSLLRQVTPENIHGEIDTDDATGREVW